jgi:hypothetical protein
MDREASQEHRAGSATALPDFIVIGAQKGGTTFFYNRLTKRHPYVEGAAKKEVHFFSRHFDRGVGWYMSHFPTPTRRNGRWVLTGEASPYYLYHPHAARRAAEVVPHAKLIVLLRNPVDRAYSHYNHQVKIGHETLTSFEEAIEAEERRLRGEKEKMLTDENYVSLSYPRFSYLSRGVYVDQLKEWHRYFDEEQLLVLKSEDLFQRTQVTFRRAQRFLGLPCNEIEFKPRKGEDRYARMDPLTRKKLEIYFEPHNQRLYDYLGVDFDW